jgi:hypothetical protein
MLFNPGGKKRNADDCRTLFAQAGFELAKIVPTTSDVSVIESGQTIVQTSHAFPDRLTLRN